LFTPRVQSSSAVRYLTVDSKLWSSHQSACQSLLLQTEKHQKLCNVRLLLPTEAAKTVVSSFVVSKIDYCNSRRFVSLTDCRLSVSGILSIGNIFRDRLNNYIGCRSRDASRSSSVCWCSKALRHLCLRSAARVDLVIDTTRPLLSPDFRHNVLLLSPHRRPGIRLVCMFA